MLPLLNIESKAWTIMVVKYTQQTEKPFEDLLEGAAPPGIYR